MKNSEALLLFLKQYIPEYSNSRYIWGNAEMCAILHVRGPTNIVVDFSAGLDDNYYHYSWYSNDRHDALLRLARAISDFIVKEPG